MHDAGFLADLGMVLGVAAITGTIAGRLGQPSILGYLFAGLLVGPYLPVPIFADPHRVETLAEFGVVLVMFAVGLEFRVAKLLQLLPTSGFTGLVQVTTMIAAGVELASLLGWSSVEAAFLGASLAISSTMVVSKVFEQTPVEEGTRGLVLGVLVLQDVVAIALITAMTAVAAGGGLDAEDLAKTLGKLGGALVAMVGLGLIVVPRMVRAVVAMRSAEQTVVFTVGLCFAVALLAEAIGYSVALGAFVAGVLVAESGQGSRIEHLVQPMRDVFAAVFFVSIGMTVDPREAWMHLPTSLLVASVVIVGQLMSVCASALLSGNGLRSALVAGLSLGQIGEFSFILGAIGVSAGVVRPSLATILVTTAVLTAFTTPWLLSRGERLVVTLDRRMPPQLRHLLSLYEEWFERLRSARDDDARPAVRALRAIAVDTLMLVLVLVLATLWIAELSKPLQAALGIDATVALAISGAGLALLSVPFLLGMLRATRALSQAVVHAVVGDTTEQSSTAQRIGVHALDVSVRIIVLGGVGLPLGVALAMLVGALSSLVWLGCLAAASTLYIWRTAEEVDLEFRSGAEAIAASLGSRPSYGDRETLQDPQLIPGLDQVETLTLPIGSAAVGLSLGELNVRARSGATVVAIQRAQGRVILPTGHEKLQLGDVLALTGSAASLQAAHRLLAEGPDISLVEPPV